VNGDHCVTAQSTLVLESGGDDEETEADCEDQEEEEVRREEAVADDAAKALVRVSAQTPPMAQCAEAISRISGRDRRRKDDDDDDDVDDDDDAGDDQDDAMDACHAHDWPRPSPLPHALCAQRCLRAASSLLRAAATSASAV
jgi:hypothetical protein